jgi:hypothetical protein
MKTFRLKAERLLNPKLALGTGRSGERGVKMVRNVTRLQGGSGKPEPVFEKVPSRNLLIMARLGEWNKCLLSARCNVSTFQRF